MSETLKPYIHPQAREMMAKLEELTGAAATCDTSTRGTFIVEHGDMDRLRLVCRFIRNSQGRLSFSSDLYQNGEPRQKVANIQAYARLFLDPALEHPNRAPVGPLPELTPIPADRELPAIVETVLGLMSKKSEEWDVEAGLIHPPDRRTGHAPGTEELVFPLQGAQPDSEWFTIQATNREKGITVQVHCGPVKPGSDVCAPQGMAAVDADGCDMMAEFGGDMSAAMERILGFRLPSSTNSPAPVGPRANTAGAVSNAVTFRRASVIRN